MSIEFYGLRLDETSDPGDGFLRAKVTHQGDGVETHFAMRLIRPDDRVVVAGAGYGGTAAILASVVGVENLVAYEANPEAIEAIAKHVRIDGKPLTVIHGAISHQRGLRTFYVSEDWYGSSLDVSWAPSEGRRSYDVVLYRLGDVLREHQATGLVLDIERGELTTLPDTDLSGLRWLVVEWHDNDTAPLTALIERAGMVVRELHRGVVTWVLAAERPE